MLSKYQSFITKNGKIIFPLYFLCLYIAFISPIVCGFDGWQRLNMTGFYLFLGAPSIIWSMYTQIGLWDSYAQFAQDFHNTIVEFGFGFAFAWLTVICTAVFLIVFYAKKKTLKPLLVVVPFLYTIISLIEIISLKAAPFIAFYIAIIALIFAIIYCVKSTPNESDSK